MTRDRLEVGEAHGLAGLGAARRIRQLSDRAEPELWSSPVWRLRRLAPGALQLAQPLVMNPQQL